MKIRKCVGSQEHALAPCLRNGRFGKRDGGPKPSHIRTRAGARHSPDNLKTCFETRPGVCTGFLCELRSREHESRTGH